MTSSGNITRLIPLRDAFFDNTLFKDVGIDAILIGLASQPCQEMDTKLVDDIRNFLFGPPGAGGMDLGAIYKGVEIMVYLITIVLEKLMI